MHAIGVGILATSRLVEFLEFELVFGFWDDGASAFGYAYASAVFLELPLHFARLRVTWIDQCDAAVVDGRRRKSVFVLLLRLRVRRTLLHVALSLYLQSENDIKGGQNGASKLAGGNFKFLFVRTMLAPSTSTVFVRRITRVTFPVVPAPGPLITATYKCQNRNVSVCNTNLPICILHVTCATLIAPVSDEHDIDTRVERRIKAINDVSGRVQCLP